MFVYMMLSVFFYLFCFFFKQKTAYERRISHWSSDVCSSDLSSASPACHRRLRDFATKPSTSTLSGFALSKHPARCLFRRPRHLVAFLLRSTACHCPRRLNRPSFSSP